MRARAARLAQHKRFCMARRRARMLAPLAYRAACATPRAPAFTARQFCGLFTFTLPSHAPLHTLLLFSRTYPVLLSHLTLHANYYYLIVYYLAFTPFWLLPLHFIAWLSYVLFPTAIQPVLLTPSILLRRDLYCPLPPFVISTFTITVLDVY